MLFLHSYGIHFAKILSFLTICSDFLAYFLGFPRLLTKVHDKQRQQEVSKSFLRPRSGAAYLCMPRHTLTFENYE